MERVKSYCKGFESFSPGIWYYHALTSSWICDHCVRFITEGDYKRVKGFVIHPRTCESILSHKERFMTEFGRYKLVLMVEHPTYKQSPIFKRDKRPLHFETEPDTKFKVVVQSEAEFIIPELAINGEDMIPVTSEECCTSQILECDDLHFRGPEDMTITLKFVDALCSTCVTLRISQR